MQSSDNLNDNLNNDLNNDLNNNIENYYKRMKTGDIILFKGRHSIISTIIQLFTSSSWSHIGIVLKDPVYIDPSLKGLFLLESGYEDIADSINHTRNYGVQLIDLRKKINEYDGIVVWRKLNANIDNLSEKINMIYQTIKDRPYDFNLYDFIETSMNIQRPEPSYSSAILNYFRPNHRKTDTFFCSALVAYIYTELGLFPKNTQWTRCLPKYFSDENPELKLIKGNLGPQHMIHH